MISEKPVGKRRHWKRYKSRGGAFVMLNMPSFFGIGGPKQVQLGPLVDISMGGLAVQYIENKERRADSSELAVAVPTHGVEIEDLTFEIVRDYRIQRLPDQRVIRGRSVRFDKLNPYQNYQLEAFIQTYTYAPREDRRNSRDRRRHPDPRFKDPAYNARHERRSGVDRRAA